MAAWDFGQPPVLAKEIRLLKQCIAGEHAHAWYLPRAHFSRGRRNRKNYKADARDRVVPDRQSPTREEGPALCGLPAPDLFPVAHRTPSTSPGRGAARLFPSLPQPGVPDRKARVSAYISPGEDRPIIERTARRAQAGADGLSRGHRPCAHPPRGHAFLPKGPPNGRRLPRKFSRASPGFEAGQSSGVPQPVRAGGSTASHFSSSLGGGRASEASIVSTARTRGAPVSRGFDGQPGGDQFGHRPGATRGMGPQAPGPHMAKHATARSGAPPHTSRECAQVAGGKLVPVRRRKGREVLGRRARGRASLRRATRFRTGGSPRTRR